MKYLIVLIISTITACTFVNHKTGNTLPELEDAVMDEVCPIYGPISTEEARAAGWKEENEVRKDVIGDRAIMVREAKV